MGWDGDSGCMKLKKKNPNIWKLFHLCLSKTLRRCLPKSVWICSLFSISRSDLQLVTPLCQLSRGGHLLSELPHSLMKSAFCPAKDQTEAPCQALQGSGHIRSETQAPCEVLHEMLLPASPRNLYVLLGCSQGPYIRISLQLSHMLLNISVSVPPLPRVFSLLYT